MGTFLTSMGANYVGLDMVYPWIIEFNVINPGGLVTIEQLTGENLAPQIISQLDFT
jgi:glutathione synthase/RimK-type ligase-like ATP-grasp enzyme